MATQIVSNQVDIAILAAVTATDAKVVTVDTVVDSIETKVNTLDTVTDSVFAHQHSAVNVYPTGAASTAVATPNGAWGVPATPTQIVPASTITAVFDLVGFCLTATNKATCEVIFYAGDPDVEVCRQRVTINEDGFGDYRPLYCPQIAANARIRCAIISSYAGINNCTVSISYHKHA